MLKLAYIESVQRRLPVKISARVLEGYIGMAWNTIVSEMFANNRNDLDILTHTYDNSGSGVTVSYDSSKDVYYSNLPVAISQLPIAGSGVRSIHSLAGKGIEFAAIGAEMQDIHSGLEVGTLDGPIPYYIVNNRVEYGNTGGIDTISGVRMRIIPKFEALDMLTDEVYFPAAQDEKIMEIVTQYAVGAQPMKETNDNNDRTP